MFLDTKIASCFLNYQFVLYKIHYLLNLQFLLDLSLDHRIHLFHNSKII